MLWFSSIFDTTLANIPTDFYKWFDRLQHSLCGPVTRTGNNKETWRMSCDGTTPVKYPSTCSCSDPWLFSSHWRGHSLIWNLKLITMRLQFWQSCCNYTPPPTILDLHWTPQSSKTPVLSASPWLFYVLSFVLWTRCYCFLYSHSRLGMQILNNFFNQQSALTINHQLIINNILYMLNIFPLGNCLNHWHDLCLMENQSRLNKINIKLSNFKCNNTW